MQWRLTSSGMAYNRDEGAVVYYHPASGDTHLISSAAFSLIQSLQGGALTEGALQARLADSLGDLESADGQQLLDDMLHELYLIHLVEPV